MTTCDECFFDWDLSPSDATRTIGDFPDGYRARLGLFLSVPDAGALRRRPSPDVWSALEYTVHVRDVIAFYDGRINRVLNEERPQLTGSGFSGFPEHEGYLDEDPLGVLDQISTTSTRLADELLSLTPERWTRIGVGIDGDERTVLVLARRLADDGQHHLLDLDRLAQSLLST